MRPPRKGKKPKAQLQVSSEGESSSIFSSSDLSDEDLGAILQFANKNTSKKCDKGKSEASSSIHVSEGVHSKSNETKSSPKVSQVSGSSSNDLQFILVGHANLHRAANNAHQDREIGAVAPQRELTLLAVSRSP